MSQKNYGTPVQMREAIQVQRCELTMRLADIALNAANDQVATDAETLFNRFVSDVHNEMLSVSIDKGLPYLAYAKTAARRWDSVKRTSVSLKKFLKTRLGIDGSRREALIAAIVGEFERVAPAAVEDSDDLCSYPE